MPDEHWSVIDGKLLYTDMPSPFDYLITLPYPPFWWHVNNNHLTTDLLPSLPQGLMTLPYPAMWWYVDDEKLISGGIHPINVGAMHNCSLITKVKIPQSVKQIGEHTFENTALSKVTIASDCTYFPTSFPEGCEVNFYPDDLTE